MRRSIPSTNLELVPTWLETLLSSHFFAACPLHLEAARNECNMFCIDCGGAGGTFCYCCRSDTHSGHRVIQIRRSSYHDVVRVAEIQNALDITGVQTYVINSARVLFLNKRPQPRGGRVAAAANVGTAAGSSTVHTCEICGRSLLDSLRFCSLGCKLVEIKRNGNANFIVNSGGGSDDETMSLNEENAVVRLNRVGSDNANIRTSRPSSSSSNSRRRKGIPHRAPFFAS